MSLLLLSCVCVVLRCCSAVHLMQAASLSSTEVSYEQAGEDGSPDIFTLRLNSIGRSADSNRSVPCWILLARTRQEYWFITPVVFSLHESLSSLGLDVQVAWAGDEPIVVDGVQKAVEQGVVPIVISISWWKAHSNTAVFTVRKVSSLGAYLILYNGETNNEMLRGTMSDARWLGAKEVWSHCEASHRGYMPDDPGIVKRFFPPGCAAGLVIDRVVQNASTRDEAHMGFVGNWPRRPKEVKSAFNSSGGVRWKPQQIKSGEEWLQFLETFPIQLNVHSNWNYIKGLETVRLAVLLTNGACVLSEQSNKDDEKAFSFIKFGDATTVLQELDALKNNPEAIRSCQAQQRAAFCDKFSPSRIASESGFASVVESLRGV